MSAIAGITRICSSLFIEPNLRPEALENHLVSVAFCARPLCVGADRPGQQRTSEDSPCNPRAKRRQIVHPIRDEMRPRAEPMGEERERSLLSARQTAPLGILVVALRHDAARQGG